MNNPNPFVPKGSLLEQQNKRRTHMKLGVLCVLTVSVAGLMVMLIQGCKQKTPTDDQPPVDTNSVPVPDTNQPPMDLSNQPPVTPTSNSVMAPTPGQSVTTASPIPPSTPPQIIPPVAPMTPPTPEVGGSEYAVKKGDSMSKIAKSNGVTLKALEAANPEAKPTKLKVGQKLVIPVGGKTMADANPGVGTAGVTDSEGTSYTVKSGDTLTKIAKAHHVKLKALQAANGLSTTKIKVGQKLKIPSKTEVAAPVEAQPVAPTVDNSTMPAPPVPMVSTSPAASTSPAPGH